MPTLQFYSEKAFPTDSFHPLYPGIDFGTATASFPKQINTRQHVPRLDGRKPNCRFGFDLS
jgi:hypothetical protein